jgi:hypothetical protein
MPTGHSKRHKNGKDNILTTEQGRKLLDEQTRRYLGISEQEFIRRWKVGKYKNNPDGLHIMRLAMLLPLTKQ